MLRWQPVTWHFIQTQLAAQLNPWSQWSRLPSPLRARHSRFCSTSGQGSTSAEDHKGQTEGLVGFWGSKQSRRGQSSIPAGSTKNPKVVKATSCHSVFIYFTFLLLLSFLSINAKLICIIVHLFIYNFAISHPYFLPISWYKFWLNLNLKVLWETSAVLKITPGWPLPDLWLWFCLTSDCGSAWSLPDPWMAPAWPLPDLWLWFCQPPAWPLAHRWQWFCIVWWVDQWRHSAVKAFAVEVEVRTCVQHVDHNQSETFKMISKEIRCQILNKSL